MIAKNPATAKDPASALKEFCPAPEPVHLPREVKFPTEMQETVSKTADVGSYPDPKQGTILAKLAANDISTRLKALAALDDWCRKHTPQARGKEEKEAGKSTDSKGKGENEGVEANWLVQTVALTASAASGADAAKAESELDSGGAWGAWASAGVSAQKSKDLDSSNQRLC